MNSDLQRERANATINVEQLKQFFGNMLLMSPKRYKKILELRKQITQDIKPLFNENFDNLDRNEKYEMVFKKSLELIEFAKKHKFLDNYMEYTYLAGQVLGPEKQVFGLHFSMFSISIDLWSTPEQKAYWRPFIENNVVFGTYIQTEMGHGTYLRGLETTATYDKSTQEFVIHSPTLTSIKFWPGSSGKTCNYAILMAKLVVDDKDCGIHAFIVQLRSLQNHTTMAGIEIGDIGRKNGYDVIDNGFIKFTHYRIPRLNMLMRFAEVTASGEFKRLGNELIMYACMLIMRGTLCMFSSLLLSISSTIAIRYSCVRRQTAATSGGPESQILDYQTQQYRLLPSLATSYSLIFATFNLRNIIFDFQNRTDFFKNIQPKDLSKLHAISSGLKSVVFGDFLKFAQMNRLCCGGHGYSASSGLGLLIQEADAGSTYEGDNVVMLLQTARYLLKCGQRGQSPHLDMKAEQSRMFKVFESYVNIYSRLFEGSIGEASDRMLDLMGKENLSEFEAWNQSSVLLINSSRCYIQIFIINSNLLALSEHAEKENDQNQVVLQELFELYLLYGICDTFTAQLLKYEIVSAKELDSYQSKLFELLQKIRVNALALVDSFDWTDANLNSTLGVYDGNVYEKLFEFARNSKFNQYDVHPVYDKYLKPYVLKQKRIDSKL